MNEVKMRRYYERKLKDTIESAIIICLSCIFLTMIVFFNTIDEGRIYSNPNGDGYILEVWGQIYEYPEG